MWTETRARDLENSGEYRGGPVCLCLFVGHRIVVSARVSMYICHGGIKVGPNYRNGLTITSTLSIISRGLESACIFLPTGSGPQRLL